jgi:sporulation protein YlmC with PRC-barrel domain
MKCQFIVAGAISAVITSGLAGTIGAESTKDAAFLVADSSKQGSGSGSTERTTTPTNAPTDLTGGQSGTPNDYAGTPVQQGKLQEVTDSKWLQQPVRGIQGDTVGEIKRVFKDQKTGEIEYVIVMPSDSKTLVPLRWSQFEEKNDQLRLNMKKEDLRSVMNAPNAKDMSPEIQDRMSEIDRVRSQPKAGQSQGSATSSPAAGGPMGESETSHGGASGSQALPPGQAPGLEGGNPSSKR